MPFALMFAGLLLTIAGVRDKQNDLYELLKGDFTGPGNYAYWVLGVVAVGSLGYIDQLRTFSRGLLGLLFVVLLLTKDKGFFDKLSATLKQSLDTPPPKGVSGVSTTSATGTTGPDTHGLPDLGISDLLKQGPEGAAYLQQLQSAWRHAPAF